VRAVVVNYEGGDLTLACLRSLQATDWPAGCLEIVLVDNASHDGVADTVTRAFPDVRVVRSATNRGFAGGCNLGMTDLGKTAYVALVNNDATVEPGWLTPLVAALQADASLGATCPKILFAGRFIEVGVQSATAQPGRGDCRDLGVRVSGARVDGADVWSRVQLVEGFWGREPDGAGQWTAASAQLRLVEGETAELELGAARPVTATLSCGPDRIELAIENEPTWHTVPFAGKAIDVINNVGSMLTDDLYGADRGCLEPDEGQFDTSAEVFAWCGAAVLLSRAYIDDVGVFDERLFLYYEDLELAWRGRERGWRYLYVPDSVVRHVHAATSVEGSSKKHYFDERNRLLVLTRHAGFGAARRAVARFLLATASYARRDAWSRLLNGHRPRLSIVGRRMHAFGGYMRRAMSMVRAGRDDRAHFPADSSDRRREP